MTGKALIGACHCGGVKFRVEHQPTEMTTCDCSLCTKRNALMTKAPETALHILEGSELLALYEWNTRWAKHYFCKVCGIYTFHRKRAAPDHFGVNVFCLDNFDASSLPVRATDGMGMSVVASNDRHCWPGPRVPADPSSHSSARG